MRLIITFILLTLTFAHLQGKKTKEILLLNSYHTGFQWTDDLTRGVIDGIGSGDETRVFVEYMDFKRFQNKAYFYELVNLYKFKYSELEFDGIICADNYAFEFFLENGDEIWAKDIPVMVCGVNNIEKKKYDTNRFKAVKEGIDVQNTLAALFKLQPQTDTLIVISDQTLTGKIFLNLFNECIEKLSTTIPYKIIDGSNYETTQRKLKEISFENKAIILLSLYSTKQNVPIEMKYIGKELLKNIDIPIYSFWNFLLDDFIIGGSLISAYDHGHMTAELMNKRIESPQEHIPNYTKTKHNLTFDFNLIKKYNLNYESLPEYTNFDNKQTPFYIRFKKQLIYFLTTLIILFIIILLLMTNIIRRKNVELKLIESEERLELALNGANEGLWDIQLRNKKIVFNNNFATLLGYESPNAMNINMRNWQKLFRAEDIHKIRRTLILHLKGITPILKLDIQIFNRQGILQYFLINGKITERNLNNIPMRLTGIIMNISAQKEFESQLKIAKNKAIESDRLKSSFLANMSHEIRTPMNAILGFSDILMCQDLSIDEKEDYLAQIKNSGENLLHIINDIVDISKIESGQLTIRNEKFDLNHLLKNVEYAGNALIKSKNKTITLTTECNNINTPKYINSDPFRLEQVLLNLISNAVKFTHKGGIILKYNTEPDGTFTFSVSDSGEGISLEDQPIIFERFRQVEQSSTTLQSGTGLGLSITKSLVHMLGGKISVASEINKGSIFTFTIPSPQY